MSDEEREAAKNPRPGDRWRKTTKAGRSIERTVTALEGSWRHWGWIGTVTYGSHDDSGGFRTGSCWCTTWWSWTSKAKLLERGPDPNAPADSAPDAERCGTCLKQAATSLCDWPLRLAIGVKLGPGAPRPTCSAPLCDGCAREHGKTFTCGDGGCEVGSTDLCKLHSRMAKLGLKP